jgi:hypothetical protein
LCWNLSTLNNIEGRPEAIQGVLKIGLRHLIKFEATETSIHNCPAANKGNTKNLTEALVLRLKTPIKFK